MEECILCGKEYKNGRELKYYIISEDIADAYCGLKYYGAKITKTTRGANGKSSESVQINNIFYSRADIERFARTLMAAKTEPSGLRAAAERCVGESIKNAAKSA